MKRLFLILFPFLLLSCVKKPGTAVECQQPDSLEFNRNYRALRASENLFKTYNPQLNRHELLCAMRYFDSLAVQCPENDSIVTLSARSHYMNGVGFYENDSVVEACREYLHALEIMDSHFDVDTITGDKARFMALTYNRLLELFSDKFIPEPAIYCIKKSIFYCKIETTSKYAVANLYSKLGTQYNIIGQIDSAYYYYNTAIASLPDYNNSIYRDVISQLAIMNYDFDNCADKAIDSFKRIIRLTDDFDEKTTRFMSLGYIYYSEHAYDSALYYLNCVFENKTNAVFKNQSADYLRIIYQKRGDSVKASEYSDYLAEYATSKYDNMLDVSILNELFNNYLEQQKNIKLYLNRKKTIYYITAISVFVVFVVFVIIFKKNKTIKDSGIKYYKEKARVNKLQRQISHKRSETEIRIASFMNETVCRKITAMICDIPVSARSNYSDYPNIKLDEESVVELGEAVSKHFPNLKNALMSNDINLKKDDLLLCYLYLLGLNNSQIALLRRCSFSTVFRQAERLRKSFKGCRSLPSFIKKIAVS